MSSEPGERLEGHLNLINDGYSLHDYIKLSDNRWIFTLGKCRIKNDYFINVHISTVYLNPYHMVMK